MKYVLFNGHRYVRDDKTGYYRRSVKRTTKLLHRDVWEHHNGKIPDGYEVHHKDFDRDNNDIGNLDLLTLAEHKKLHAQLLTDEQRAWRRNNINVNARPKAIEWHKSKAGSAWHKEHIKRQRECGKFKKHLVCTNCGKEYIGESKGTNSFCSNACKSAHRRASGVDDEERECVICNNTFIANRYSKTQTCSKSCHAALIWEHRYESKECKKNKRKKASVRFRGSKVS